MKKFVIFTNYGLEGWKITGEADDFQEAIRLRERALCNGNPEVWIFEPVEFSVVRA